MGNVRKAIFWLTVSVAGLSLSFGAQAESGVLAKVRSSGTLTLGYREASIPFSYLGADQKPVGLSMELCSAIAEKVKTELKLPNLKVDYTVVSLSNRIPLIQNGTVDIECGSTTNTVERQKQVSFSVATFASRPSWVTMAASGIADANGLKGKTVVFTQASVNIPLGQKISKDDGLNLTIIQAKDHAESLLMVRTGRAVAWLEDHILQAGLVANSQDPKGFKFLPNEYGGTDYYGLMLKKDDPEFKALVDGVIKEMMVSGEFTKLYNKWFTNPIPPEGKNLSVPMSDALKARVASPSDSATP